MSSKNAPKLRRFQAKMPIRPVMVQSSNKSQFCRFFWKTGRTRKELRQHYQMCFWFYELKTKKINNTRMIRLPLIVLIRRVQKMKELSIYETLREEYPEYISKEQLYKICHISKRKASYLLESGLIPCKNSGKQTRKYTIALRDVACFLEQRKNRPAKYETPPQLKSKRKVVYSKIKLDSEEYTTALRQFYINMLATVNDVLTINEVSEITGYSSSSIVKWVSGEKLRSIHIRNRYYIPKEYLLDFMVGQYYWRIAQKSPKHIADFAVFDKEYSEH